MKTSPLALVCVLTISTNAVATEVISDETRLLDIAPGAEIVFTRPMTFEDGKETGDTSASSLFMQTCRTQPLHVGRAAYVATPGRRQVAAMTRIRLGGIQEMGTAGKVRLDVPQDKHFLAFYCGSGLLNPLLSARDIKVGDFRKSFGNRFEIHGQVVRQPAPAMEQPVAAVYAAKNLSEGMADAALLDAASSATQAPPAAAAAGEARW